MIVQYTCTWYWSSGLYTSFSPPRQQKVYHFVRISPYLHASSRKSTVLQNISIPKIVNTHVCWVSKRSYQSLYCLYVVTGQWVQTFCMYCGCFSLPSFFLAHCYYFDTVLLYLNINVICHTVELKQCDVLCKSDINFTCFFFLYL